MPVKVSGVREVTANMRRSANGAQSGAARAARRTAQTILDESQIIVPVQTGSLLNSGHTTEHMLSTGISVSVSYGSASGIRDSREYSVYVHEDLNKKHAPGKSAKYLEIPFVRNAAGFLKNMHISVWTGIREAMR